MAHIANFLLPNKTLWVKILEDTANTSAAVEELIRLFAPAEYLKKYT